MSDLDRRLRSLDRLEAPNLWSAAVARAQAAQQPGVSWWESRPLAIAAAAALVTLVAIGGVVWLIRWVTEAPTPPVVTTTLPVTTTTIPVTTTTTTTSTTTVTTTTTAASTTTSLAPGPAALPMTWQRVPAQAAFDGGQMVGVLAAGPGLVAFGVTDEPALWVSADGLAWERVAGAGVGVVAQGPDGLVALGFGRGTSMNAYFGGCSTGSGEPTAATSADGLTWTTVPQPIEEFCSPDRISQTVAVEAIAAVGDRFVAVGWEMSTTENALVWASDDGTTWTRVEDPALIADADDGNHLAMTGVTAGGPGLVAVGSAGVNDADCFDCVRPAVWVSEDGLSWERLGDGALDIAGVQASIDASFYRVAADPQTGALFAMAPGWGLWASADGLRWQRVPEVPPGSPLSIAFTAERLVAVGSFPAGARVWASQDGGASWGLVDHGNPGFADASSGGGTGMNAVTAFGSAFVAVGYEGGPAGIQAAVWIGTWDD